MTTIYTSPALPLAWVVRHLGKYFIVPACANGWARRTAFLGHVTALAQVADYNKIALGLPS